MLRGPSPYFKDIINYDLYRMFLLLVPCIEVTVHALKDIISLFVLLHEMFFVWCPGEVEGKKGWPFCYHIRS